MNSLETKFEEVLIADGFSQEEITSTVLKARKDASDLIREYGGQQPLHEYLLSRLRRGRIMELLPFLVA